MKRSKLLIKMLRYSVIIITGTGEKAFVAGADIKEFADFSVADGGKLAQKGQTLLFDFVANLGTPVIAAINGFALPGGQIFITYALLSKLKNEDSGSRSSWS
ncbi:enoyl-CoA hydratase-related protein [Tritonibacter mobilis]|nr:enoyl-CoA hydratase-related protein [Tritonibacter mobilis]